jgi:membrane dipeptidase
MPTPDRLNNIHSQTIVTDAHSDYAIHMLLEQRRGRDDVFYKDHLPRLRSAGVRLEVMTVGGDFTLAGTDCRSPLNVFAALDCVQREIERRPRELMLVRTVADLESLAKDRVVGLMLALEGATPIDADFCLLRTYYRLGLRSVILTHNERNMFAEGCREKANGGLSALGKKLVEELNRMNLILDLVHVGERTFYDAMEVFARPPVVSHSNARRLCEHFRNLTDAQIKAVAARGGVIGLNFFGIFIDEDPTKVTIDRLLDHIVYISDLVGIQHVGLGPDFCDYYLDVVEDWLVQIGFTREMSMLPKGIEDVRGIPRITEALLGRGFSDQDIQGVLGENFVRVYKLNLE